MRKVYILSAQDYVEVGITMDGKLEQFYKLSKDLLTGSVILGKVDTIRKAVGIFVDIGQRKNGLLPYREGLKKGDMVCVQVVKEGEGDKGCQLTEKITLAGRFVVLNDIGEWKFSQKISEERKAELKELIAGDKVGFIFRSSAQNAKVEHIKKEMQKLTSRYEDILLRIKNNYKISFVYVDSSEEIAQRYAYSDEEIVYGFEEIAQQLAVMYQRKVEVDGVELVFDKTEAMTVVDINSKRYNRQFGSAKKANFEANCVAVKELARQLRLRNIGGIIMVDFISLTEKEDKQKLLELLKKECKKDNVMVKVELIESLSLFAITRKQRYTSL